MLGFENRVRASFNGAIYADGDHLADIVLDGTGTYSGERKLWRFRLVNGQVEDHGDYVMRMNERTRPIRFSSPAFSDAIGYIELL